VLSQRVNLSKSTTLATVLLVLLGAASNTAAAETDPPLLPIEQFCRMERLDVAKE
jgi:hypothetical protein